LALPLGPEGPSLPEVASRYARPRGARWAPVPPELDAAIAADEALAEAARRARAPLIAVLSRRFEFNQRLLDAVLRAPRERFVLPEDIPSSADDTPLPLDDAGHATVSAPHAYLLSFELLALAEGDHLIELGTGTGYGAALARRIVGPAGHVTSIEIDPALHARARRLLHADHDPSASGVTLLCGDGRALAERLLADRGLDAPPRVNPRKIAVTYALRAAPAGLELLLAEGDRLVAPIGAMHDIQDLVLVERRAGAVRREMHGAVRYVAERG
jgi:protein-L-isoaspartate(D-aspartate) O-methyltransferase